MAMGAACLFLSACGGTGQSGAQDLFSAFTTGYNPTATSAPALPTRPRARFSPENPATILVIGDSLSNGFGTFLKMRAEQLDLNARVINQGKSSSGLTRGDFYDWPARFEGFAAQYDPDIIVAHFGANDMQTIISSTGRVTFGSSGWEDAYRAKIQEILDIAERSDASVYWFGPGPDSHTNLHNHLQYLNPIFEEEVRSRRGRFVAINDFAAGPGGTYITTVPIEGVQTRIRTADGSHFTSKGYFLVVDKLLAAMRRDVPDMFGIQPDISVALQ